MRRKYLRKTTRYGVLPSPEGKPPVLSRLAEADVSHTVEWAYHSIPVDSQGGTNACVGYSTANWLEAMLRKHLGRDVLKPTEQIDGELIWRTGREMFFPDEPVEDSGLWLHHGFKAAIALGLLPPGTIVQEVRQNRLDVLSQRLKEAPLVMAQATHQQWNNPKRESGFIKKAKGDVYAGHAVLMVGITQQAGKNFVLLQNSWGLDWGWHGLGLLSEAHYYLNNMAPCCTAKLPEGWQSYDGWRKYVHIRPETA
jgi:C1A family cysteine protease